MIARFGPRSLTVAIAAVMAVLMLVPGSRLGPSVVSADVSGISAGASTVTDNQQVSITVTAQDDDGALQISTNDSDDLLTVNSCSGAGSCGAGTITGNGTSSVSINTDAASIDGNVIADSFTVNLTLRADCDNVTETITVTASQPGGASRSTSITCNPVSTALRLSINKQANFTNASFPFVYSVNGGTCVATKGGSTVGSGSSDDFSLSDNQTAVLDCTAGSVVTVQEQVDSTVVDVSCSDAAGVTVGSRSVRVNASQSDGNVSCTFHNNVVSTVPASIQLSAAQLTPNCGTSTTLSAYVIGANGAVVPNGTVVTFSATPGTLNATSATTFNGVATVTYTAPANFANMVTIIASSGSATASGQIRVVCVGAVAPVAPTQAPSAPAPTATPRPATPPLVVAPPSAGDGGLLDGNSFSWALFAGILFVAAAAMGIGFIT
ncbi:MAG: hypothetical protein AB7G38_07000, partial [Dehalococcoidia bacterium]